MAAIEDLIVRKMPVRQDPGKETKGAELSDQRTNPNIPLRNLNGARFIVVSVVQAKGLFAKDENGSSNPYCVVHLDNLEFRSFVVDCCVDPFWNLKIIV